MPRGKKNLTPEEQRVADIAIKKQAILEYAKSSGNVDLALIAVGNEDPWVFIEKVTRENAGKATIGNSSETLKTRLSANQKRRKELEKWLKTESLEPYRSYYAKELELIEECQIQAIYDLLIDLKYLNDRA